MDQLLPVGVDPNLIWYHVVTVGAIVGFKLAVLVVGFLIGRLGYDLLVKGVTGQFKFKAELEGRSADFVSASPGLFFILMATVLMSVAIWRDKPFGMSVTLAPASAIDAESHAADSDPTHMPALPRDASGLTIGGAQ